MSSIVRVSKHEDPEHPAHTGAYVEIFERDGVVVGRMNLFDSDHPRGGEQLKAYHRALGEAIERIEQLSARDSR